MQSIEHKERINKRKSYDYDQDYESDEEYHPTKKVRDSSNKTVACGCYSRGWLMLMAHAIIEYWIMYGTIVAMKGKGLSNALSTMRKYVRENIMPRDVQDLMEAEIPGLDWSEQPRGRKAMVKATPDMQAKRAIVTVRRADRPSAVSAKLDVSHSEYDDSIKVNCMYKETHNAMFVQYAKASYLKSGGRVLYLDTKEQRTTKLLQEAGFMPWQLHCVNKNFSDVKILRRDGRCTVFHMTMADFLGKNIGKYNYAAVWFDYCASWQGSICKNMFVQQDIELLLGANYMLRDSTFGLTVSRHGAKLPDTPDFDTDKYDFLSREVDNFVTEVTEQAQLSAKLAEDAMSYGKKRNGTMGETTQSSGMLFHLYSLQ